MRGRHKIQRLSYFFISKRTFDEFFSASVFLYVDYLKNWNIFITMYEYTAISQANNAFLAISKDRKVRVNLNIPLLWGSNLPIYIYFILIERTSWVRSSFGWTLLLHPVWKLTRCKLTISLIMMMFLLSEGRWNVNTIGISYCPIPPALNVTYTSPCRVDSEIKNHRSASDPVQRGYTVNPTVKIF